MPRRLAVFLTLVLGSVQVEARTTGEIVCSYAPSQSKIVAAISGAAGSASATVAAVAAATGLQAVAHSSGALILTGSGGYIAGTLGTAAAVPVIVAVGLVVGGTAVTVELVCASTNYPAQVAKVHEAADEYLSRFNDAMREAKTSLDGTVRNARKTVEPAAKTAVHEVRRAADDAWEYAYRTSVEVSDSLGL